MSIGTKDCKDAICALVNSPDGLKTLAMAYSGTSNVCEFIKHAYMCNNEGEQIQSTIDNILKYAGSQKYWARHSKETLRNGQTCRCFNCNPFDDSLRAYVWDDGNTILRINIEGE